MADLNDLKGFAAEIGPVLKQLFELLDEGGAEVTDETITAAEKAIERFESLLDEAGRQTAAPCEERLAAIVAVRGAVINVRDLALTHEVALSDAQRDQLKRLTRELRLAVDELIEECVSTPITRLITQGDLQRFRRAAGQAREEIAERRRAKQALDVTIKLVVVAANVAAKLVAL